ncbi:DUF4113 domain-containing protein [Pseudomonas brassicacearum]|uniref:DUF4113 domain-containing protein n=1 Tax=Pseudomonas brassicacearum TaxID=930166 RepID=UPI003857D435
MGSTPKIFSISQPEAIDKVMGVLDAINGRWGRGTMRLASGPVISPTRDGLHSLPDIPH